MGQLYRSSQTKSSTRMTGEFSPLEIAAMTLASITVLAGLIGAGVAVADIISKKYQERRKPSSPKKPAAKDQKPAAKDQKPPAPSTAFDMNGPWSHAHKLSTLFHYPENSATVKEEKKSK